MVEKYDDLRYTICLICKPGNDLEVPRSILKAEFNLREASGEKEGIGRALVLPLPIETDKDGGYRSDMIYRIRFNQEHSAGPVIDFKYGNDVPKDILMKDPRKYAIKRAASLVEVLDIIDWGGKRLNLSFLKNPAFN